jgi:hypothetical protein
MRRRPIAFAALALALTVTCLPTSARADKLDRPKITLTKRGNDLEIVVHNVTDFCANAETRIVRTSDSIRILRERPSNASRCLSTRDLTFIAPNVGAGRYTVSYERLPLIAPIRWIQVASTTALVE